MKGKRFKPEQISKVLKEFEARKSVQEITAFLRTFSCLSPDISYESTNVYLSRIYKNLSHTPDTGYAWHSRPPNKARRKSGVGVPGLQKVAAVPCLSPSSVTLPSGPIPICPAYTSAKSSKSGTLAKWKRLHSGRKAHREREGWNIDWYGVIPETAWNPLWSSMPTQCILVVYSIARERSKVASCMHQVSMEYAPSSLAIPAKGSRGHGRPRAGRRSFLRKVIAGSTSQPLSFSRCVLDGGSDDK